MLESNSHDLLRLGFGCFEIPVVYMFGFSHVNESENTTSVTFCKRKAVVPTNKVTQEILGVGGRKRSSSGGIVLRR